jgi:hypothetical protein
VPGAIKKLAVEKRFDIAEYLRLARRVKAMAAVIDRYPLKLEAAGIPAHVIALLYDDDIRFFAARELPRGAKPCRACAKDRHPRAVDCALAATVFSF